MLHTSPDRSPFLGSLVTYHTVVGMPRSVNMACLRQHERTIPWVTIAPPPPPAQCLRTTWLKVCSTMGLSRLATREMKQSLICGPCARDARNPCRFGSSWVLRDLVFSDCFQLARESSIISQTPHPMVETW